MSFSSWLRKQTPRRVRRRGQSGAAAARFRPRLEGLEERWAPSAGALDPTFGTCGISTTDFPPGPGSDAGQNVAILQPDGKILVVGSTRSAAGGDFALARY